MKANKWGSFKIEVLNPFFQPIYTIAYHKGVFSLLSFEKKRLYRVRTPWNGDVFIGKIPLSPSFISSVIFGSPIISGAEIEEGKFLDGVYRLEITVPDGLGYTLLVNPERLFIKKFIAYNAFKKPLYEVKSDFVLKEGTHFPSKVKGVYGGIEMDMDYSRIGRIKNPEEKEFELPLPPQVEEIFLDGSIPFESE